MASSTTTLFDIASIDAFLYAPAKGAPKPTLPTDNGTWTLVKNFAAPTTSAFANLIGFKPIALQNSITGEIVIAFRGTEPGSNLVEDLLLGTAGVLSLLNPIVLAADEFAQAVAKANPNSVITLTGHSLGGYLAQAATVNLLNSGILTTSAQGSLDDCDIQRSRTPTVALSVSCP